MNDNKGLNLTAFITSHKGLNKQPVYLIFNLLNYIDETFEYILLTLVIIIRPIRKVT